MNLPNKISISRIIAIPFFIIALVMALDFGSTMARYIAAIIFILISLTDILDGYIARKRNQVTEKGKILDPIADKLLMFSAMIFLANRGVPAWIIFILLCRELLVVGFRSLMFGKKVLPVSRLGKAKTFFLTVGIVMVLLKFPYSIGVILLGTVLSVVSALNYLFKATKHIRSPWMLLKNGTGKSKTNRK